MTEEQEWYTPAEAAKFLGVSVKRLAYLRREKRIIGRSAGTRFTMYHIDELRRVDIKDLRRKQPDGQENHPEAA